MQSGLVLRIEKTLDRAASALFAAACGYAAFAGFVPRIAQLSLAVESVCVAGFAYLLCLRALNTVQPKPRKAAVPIFNVREIDDFALAELVLTDRYEPTARDEALLLDDILAEIGPESRVVRLFDAAAMPTPGQLNDRIRHRLGEGCGSPKPGDAAQALHEALAELRQSLR